jgi:hypothetical protein
MLRRARTDPAIGTAITNTILTQSAAVGNVPIDVSSYPDDVEVPSFQRQIKCGKCGGKPRCQPKLRYG